MNLPLRLTFFHTHIRSESIQRAATKWTLLAAIAGMSIYGTIEYFATGAKSLPDFATHHLLDVAIIMLAVWFASWLAIRRAVIEPVNRIFVHLRRMASGRIEYLDGDMGSKELADVAASINRLVFHLSKDRDLESVSEGLDSLRRLRSELKKVSDGLGEAGVPVMRALGNLEGSLLHMLSAFPGDPAAGEPELETQVGV